MDDFFDIPTLLPSVAAAPRSPLGSLARGSAPVLSAPPASAAGVPTSMPFYMCPSGIDGFDDSGDFEALPTFTASASSASLADLMTNVSQRLVGELAGEPSFDDFLGDSPVLLPTSSSSSLSLANFPSGITWPSPPPTSSAAAAAAAAACAATAAVSSAAPITASAPAPAASTAAAATLRTSASSSALRTRAATASVSASRTAAAETAVLLDDGAPSPPSPFSLYMPPSAPQRSRAAPGSGSASGLVLGGGEEDDDLGDDDILGPLPAPATAAPASGFTSAATSAPASTTTSHASMALSGIPFLMPPPLTAPLGGTFSAPIMTYTGGRLDMDSLAGLPPLAVDEHPSAPVHNAEAEHNLHRHRHPHQQMRPYPRPGHHHHHHHHHHRQPQQPQQLDFLNDEIESALMLELDSPPSSHFDSPPLSNRSASPSVWDLGLAAAAGDATAAPARDPLHTVSAAHDLGSLSKPVELDSLMNLLSVSKVGGSSAYRTHTHPPPLPSSTSAEDKEAVAHVPRSHNKVSKPSKASRPSKVSKAKRPRGVRGDKRRYCSGCDNWYKCNDSYNRHRLRGTCPGPMQDFEARCELCDCIMLECSLGKHLEQAKNKADMVCEYCDAVLPRCNRPLYEEHTRRCKKEVKLTKRERSQKRRAPAAASTSSSKRNAAAKPAFPIRSTPKQHARI